MAPRRLAALTLLELVLALAIVTLLLGVVVINLSSWGDRRRLDEGADRFESLLHMAKADAANLGKRLRLSFEADEQGQPTFRLLWEPDGLGAPNQFTDYAACTWLYHVPVGLVEVVRCELTDQSAYDLTERRSMERDERDQAPLDPLTFYPDGSCDSAVIELASTADDPRTAVFEIQGITGSISRRVLTASELSDLRQQEARTR